MTPTKCIQIKNHQQESECIAHWSVDLWLQSYHRHALATRLDNHKLLTCHIVSWTFINPPGKSCSCFDLILPKQRGTINSCQNKIQKRPVQIRCCGLPHVMHVPSVLIAAKALSVAWMLQTLTNWSLTAELSPPCGPLPQVTTSGMTKNKTLRNLKVTILPPTHRFGTWCSLSGSFAMFGRRNIQEWQNSPYFSAGLALEPYSRHCLICQDGSKSCASSLNIAHFMQLIFDSRVNSCTVTWIAFG